MMTGYEANFYSAMIAAMPRIAKALERIADQLERLNGGEEKEMMVKTIEKETGDE